MYNLAAAAALRLATASTGSSSISISSISTHARLLLASSIAAAGVPIHTQAAAEVLHQPAASQWVSELAAYAQTSCTPPHLQLQQPAPQKQRSSTPAASVTASQLLWEGPFNQQQQQQQQQLAAAWPSWQCTRLSLWQQQQQQQQLQPLLVHRNHHYHHIHNNITGRSCCLLLHSRRDYHQQHPSGQPPEHCHGSNQKQQQQQQLKQQQLPPQQQQEASGGDAAPCGAAPLGSSWTSLPNLLSLSRVAMGPWLAYCIATQQWPVAVGLTAAAGASDWLDGYLARRLGHTSKLGSYLDPLADKLFVATAVGTMGLMGMLPAWLAVLVVGRDSSQVAGMFWYRLRMFGGTWPGATTFFDVDHAAAAATSPSTASSRNAAAVVVGGDAASAGQDLPTIRPLLVSKANTALIMTLVAACMAHQWQGVPDAAVLEALELSAAGTTLASAGAYAWLHWTGQLLAPAKDIAGK